MRKTIILVLLKISLHFEQIKQETVRVAALWSVRTAQDEKTCSRLHLGRTAPLGASGRKLQGRRKVNPEGGFGVEDMGV